MRYIPQAAIRATPETHKQSVQSNHIHILNIASTAPILYANEGSDGFLLICDSAILLIWTVYQDMPTDAPINLTFGNQNGGFKSSSSSRANGSVSNTVSTLLPLFCKMAGRSGRKIDPRPIPRRSAWSLLSAVWRCAGERRPPVRRIRGTGDPLRDGCRRLTCSLAIVEKWAKKA